MTDADVERLARALCREWGYEPDCPAYTDPKQSRLLWEDYAADARRLLVEQRATLRARPEGKWTFGWHQVPADLGTVPAKITPVEGPRQGGQCPTAGDAVSSPDEAGGRQQTAIGEVG